VRDVEDGVNQVGNLLFEDGFLVDDMIVKELPPPRREVKVAAPKKAAKKKAEAEAEAAKKKAAKKKAEAAKRKRSEESEEFEESDEESDQVVPRKRHARAKAVPKGPTVTNLAAALLGASGRATQGAKETVNSLSVDAVESAGHAAAQAAAQASLSHDFLSI
jgi:NADH dehydrogenase/NADH:ubiquinone oxidoreductase subunit G